MCLCVPVRVRGRVCLGDRRGSLEHVRLFHLQLLTRNPQPATRNPQPSTRNPQSSTLNPQPAILNPHPATLNLQPPTRNPQPQPHTAQSTRPNPLTSSRTLFSLTHTRMPSSSLCSHSRAHAPSVAVSTYVHVLCRWLEQIADAFLNPKPSNLNPKPCICRWLEQIAARAADRAPGRDLKVKARRRICRVLIQ
jgi:hypothetical protein